MKQKTVTNKLRLPEKGFYTLALERILSCKSPNSNLIRFPDVISKLASSFSIPKRQVWEILFLFHDLDFIEIVCGHGIRINSEVFKNE